MRPERHAPRRACGLVLSALVLGQLMLSACGDPEPGASSGADTGGEQTVITLNAESDSWPAAQISGTLAERESCLLIDDRVAVFPFGTIRDAEGVTFAGGGSVPVPSRVQMGGGVFDLAVTQSDLPIVPMDEVRECARATGATEFVWARPLT